MELQVCNAAEEDLPATEETQVDFHEQLREAIVRGSIDFDTWTSVISEIEKTYPDNIESICLVYDSFLSKFPLCYGYWRKYAEHHARLCTVEKAVQIFERAVQSATYSVGLWVGYCSFSMSISEDPNDVRRIFRRAVSFVGKDYLCHALWDQYILFELSNQQWSFLAHIYIQTLRFPTKKLHGYFDNFKKFTSILKEEVKCQNDYCNDSDSEDFVHETASTPKDKTSRVIEELLGPSVGSLRSKALQKYISIGEQFYGEACRLEEKIHCFETEIRRPYFHVKPLDDKQLENWHRYLDFVETQQDFDWVVKLYERSLIPCANYPEFWMRYVEFMESKGGREIANYALDRATQIFLKNVPAIHLFNARFKEQIKDLVGARAAFPLCDAKFNSYFVENVVKEANMEKRVGNFAAAFHVYEKAFDMASERQKLHTVSVLYIHFSRLKYLITESSDAAIEVIVNGIRKIPDCKLLLEGLINFAMTHGGPRQVNVVDSVIANAISPGPDLSQGLSTEDREAISLLYLEFVDYCGTTDDVRKGWNRHIKLFSHSVRTTSFDYPTSRDELLSIIRERRQNNPSSMPEQAFRDPSSGHIFTELEDTGRLQRVASNVLEHSGENALEVNKSTHDLVPHQSAEDALIHEPMESTHDPVHESREEESGMLGSPRSLEHQGFNDLESLEASQENTDSVDVKQELKLPSVESLSLNLQNEEPRNSIPMESYECDTHQSNSTSDRVPESCPDTNVNPSSRVQNDLDEDKLKSPSPSDQNPKNNMVNTSENTNRGLQIRLQNQEPYPPDETDPQKLVNQDYPRDHSTWQYPQVDKGTQQAQNQYWVGADMGNSTAWPMQNMQHQSIASISQREQVGHPQSSQSYNQTSEYYYYQQQQQLQQQYPQQDPQQLMMFQQQLYMQQQQQQQYYQQLQQQQGQQKMWQQHYYRLQQWQQYQQQYLQQQQEYQQRLQQAQAGPQEEYQKLQQQAEQQQQWYQQMLQQQQEYQQQMQQAQLQHQQGYNQPQQITSTHAQTWNGNYYQQGQAVTGASGPAAESPHLHQQSPQALTPPHSAGMLGLAISPHHQQQSLLGVNPPNSAGASGLAASPHPEHRSPETQ